MVATLSLTGGTFYFFHISFRHPQAVHPVSQRRTGGPRASPELRLRASPSTQGQRGLVQVGGRRKGQQVVIGEKLSLGGYKEDRTEGALAEEARVAGLVELVSFFAFVFFIFSYIVFFFVIW